MCSQKKKRCAFIALTILSPTRRIQMGRSGYNEAERRSWYRKQHQLSGRVSCNLEGWGVPEGSDQIEHEDQNRGALNQERQAKRLMSRSVPPEDVRGYTSFSKVLKLLNFEAWVFSLSLNTILRVPMIQVLFQVLFYLNCYFPPYFCRLLFLCLPLKYWCSFFSPRPSF